MANPGEQAPFVAYSLDLATPGPPSGQVHSCKLVCGMARGSQVQGKAMDYKSLGAGG